MKIAALVDFFIHEDRFLDRDEIRRSRLFVRACLLTSIFSNSYIGNSILFEYDKGVALMIFNGVGYLLLPFLAQTKLPITLLGNIYVLIGAIAINILAYYSGGIWSPLYPWIIATPVLALLVVNKTSGFVWGGISLAYMIWLGVLDINGEVLPIEYNLELKTELYLTIIPGLLLIILFIAFVFEGAERRSRVHLELQYNELEEQKDTISKQSAELKELVDQKEYIIRILAHDLRNPLKNISGLVSLLKNDKEKQHQEEYVEMINQASSNAQDLVGKVLEMDATDQEGVNIELSEVNLDVLLRHVIDGLNNAAKGKEIELLYFNEVSSSIVQTDETYLKLVVENLVSNAIKFSETGKNVKIKLLSTNASLRIKIIDEGPGISPEEEDKLFKKFSRLSTRPTAGESSTGLGLSLVKRYSELIGGKVWYERNDEVGATFVVELPIA